MIYYDPTEARANTLLSQSVIKHGKPLPTLETLTGADILITPTPIPMHSITQMPGKQVFRNIVGKSWLLQRKSGRDLLNSIPHLRDILRRMLEFDAMPWLVTSGVFLPSSKNPKDKLTTVVNSDDTNWTWNSVQGALDNWQISGGCFHNEPTDALLGEWILRADSKVAKFAANPEQFVYRPTDVQHLKHDLRKWRAVLEGFPGIGSELSMRIADYCGDLKTSLMWITSSDTGIDGIGAKSKEQWKKFAGLESGECLAPTGDDDQFEIRQAKVMKIIEEQNEGLTLDDILGKI